MERNTHTRPQYPQRPVAGIEPSCPLGLRDQVPTRSTDAANLGPLSSDHVRDLRRLWRNAHRIQRRGGPRASTCPVSTDCADIDPREQPEGCVSPHPAQRVSPPHFTVSVGRTLLVTVVLRWVLWRCSFVSHFRVHRSTEDPRVSERNASPPAAIPARRSLSRP